MVGVPDQSAAAENLAAGLTEFEIYIHSQQPGLHPDIRGALPVRARRSALRGVDDQSGG
jgi:hypothetical protein